MRYHLHEHPAFPGLLSKEDLFLLVERGSLARGDLCTDTLTRRDHTVGDVISGMRAPRPARRSRIGRPAYQEIRADDPQDNPEAEDEDEAEEESLETEPVEDEDETLDGEEVLHHSNPAWLGFSKALFLALLLIITTGMLMLVEPLYAPVSAIAAVCLFTAIIISRLSRHYYVTDERVEVVWGILGRSSNEVRICDIRSIDVYEKGLKGLLGLGTVDFSSAANAGIEVQFRDIRGAHQVKDLVRQLQRGVARQD